MEAVGNYPDLASARLAQSVLAAFGIESEIPDEYLAGIDWEMGTALHGITLPFIPEEAEAARALLANIVLEVDPGDQEGGSVILECEVCSGDGPGAPRWRRRLKAASLLFAPLLLVYVCANLVVSARKCPSCGRT